MSTREDKFGRKYHQEWRAANLEAQKAYARAYYLENADRLRAAARNRYKSDVPVQCECGRIVYNTYNCRRTKLHRLRRE